MTNGWDTVADQAKRHSESAGVFVQLKGDGDKATGVFCGEPYARECAWVEGEGYQPFDASTHTGRPTLRVAINFFDLVEGRMKVFDGSSQWFRAIVAVREKFPLDQWSVEVKRQGAARDTKTSYTVLPNAQIDPMLRAQIAGCRLHDLESVTRVEQASAEASTRPGQAASGQRRPANGPIDSDSAQRLLDRLRQLPRSAVDEFLRELGVTRIREIPAAKHERAEQFLSQLERAYRKDDQEQDDPFA